jgi:predicted metalloprotease
MKKLTTILGLVLMMVLGLFASTASGQYGNLSPPTSSLSFATSDDTLFSPESSASSEVAIDELRQMAHRLDSYYRTLFALSHQDYISPNVTLLPEGETAYTPCGPASGEELAFYCHPGHDIVFSEELILTLYEMDDVLPAHVLAHEWGHHVQYLAGQSPTIQPEDGDWNQVFSIEHELRSDCLAGAFVATLPVDDTDMASILLISSQIGDESGSIWIIQSGRGMSHGTGMERMTAAMRGYEYGALGCLSIAPTDRDDEEMQPNRVSLAGSE